MDPPYDVDQQVLDELLTQLVENSWLTEGTTVVVERGIRDAALVWPVGFDVGGVRKYGDTVLVTGIWYGLDT